MEWFAAVIAAPIVSYLIAIGVMWLSSASVFYAVSALDLRPVGVTQIAVVVSMTLVPLALSIWLTQKWIKFCAERYEITRFGIAVHVTVVSIAVIATLVRLVMILPWG